MGASEGHRGQVRIMQKIFNDTYSVREKEERFLKHIWSDNVQPSKMRLTEPKSSHPRA